MEPTDIQEPENKTKTTRLRRRWSLLPSWAKEVVSTAAIFFAAFVLAILLNKFAIQSYQVEGQSMEPTLSNNDRLIVNKIPRTFSRITGGDYIPKRGDIIIFSQSGLNFGNHNGKELIKRVIGLPEERVEVKDGRVKVYNDEYSEGFEPDSVGGYKIASSSTPGTVDVTLRDNEIFVCGDNRTNSEDSRYFGPLLIDKIVGKLVLRILPLNEAEKF